MTQTALRVPALALALSLVALTACDKEKAADGDSKSDDKTAEKADDKKADDKAGDDAKQVDDKADDKAGDEAKAATPPAGASASGGDGVAYFAVNNRGIAKLDASGWSMVTSDSRAYYSKMFSGPDGSVYVMDFDSIDKIEGDKLTEVAKFDYKTFSGASNVAPAPDGKFHATSYKAYAVWDKGNWAVTEAAGVQAGLESLSGVALAGDGTVWVSGPKTIAYNKGGTWAALDLSSFGKHFFFSHLSASPTGDVFVTSGRELIKLTPEKAEKIEFKLDSRNYNSYNLALAYNKAGKVLAASGNCGLVSLDPAKPEEVWTVEKGGYNCLSLVDVALDGQNRAWVYSREGLSVIAPDKSATEYPTSTVMEIVTSNLTGMVVLGDGPALPAAGPTHNGSVTGKVLLEGEAVANAKIEMCSSPSYGGSQPCYEAKVKFAGTTNDKGEFSFADVPIGQYNVAVEIDGKWRMYFLSSLANDMKEGGSYDVGAVKFNKM